jgi:endonuclease G, mitochondrial
MSQRDVVIAEVGRLFGADVEALAERLSTVDEADAPDFSGLDPARRPELLRRGAAGLRKIGAGQPGAVTDAEVIGLEAIILLEGRPALVIKGGDFLGVPERWQILTTQRDAIRTSIARVGRIEVTGHPGSEWVGTGFLAGPGTVVTARHVAREFARLAPDHGWRFRTGMGASIDLDREQGATGPSEFAITGIVGLHERYDLAALAVTQTGGHGQALPAPLPVATAAPGAGAAAAVRDRTVYVVGYPAWDGTRNDAAHMRELFGGVYDVKRLQPGLITSWPDGAYVLTHDCSTLGGNSGSPVIDLETHQVIGVHYGGAYLAANNAVPLWLMTGDELLRKANVNFTEALQ